MLHIKLPGGVKREFAVGTTLAEMGKDFSDNYDSPLAVGVFDGLEYSLSYQVTEDGEVSFIPMNSVEGMRAFVRSIVFVCSLIRSWKSVIRWAAPCTVLCRKIR